MSWSKAARLSSISCSVPWPSRAAILSAISVTRNECDAVNGDLASTTSANPRAMRSRVPGPASRAHLDQLGRHARAGAGQHRHAARALAQRIARHEMLEPEPGGLERVAPVHELEPVLGEPIVPAEQLVDACRAARAADVLEHHGVVEIAPVLEREAQVIGELHADQAGPERVTHGLALGEVEGEGQGSQNFRDPYGLCRWGWRGARGHVVDIGGGR